MSAPGRPGGALGRALGNLAAASARRRVAVTVAAFLLMGGLAVGVTRLQFQEQPVDYLPRSDPNTPAARNFTASFPGAAFGSPVFVSVDPAKWAAANARLPNRQMLTNASVAPTANQASDQLNALLTRVGAGNPGQPVPVVARPVPGPGNITDEVYMRGMEELFRFLQARIPELRWAITLESQVRLVNYTNTGVPGPTAGATGQALQPPNPASFTMPGTDPAGEAQYASDWSTFVAANPAAVRAVVSKDWSSTRLAFLFEPNGRSVVDIGRALYAAVDDYRATVRACDRSPSTCPVRWNVFDPDQVIVDPRANTTTSSYLTDTTLHDLGLLAPLAGLVVLALLLLEFRRLGTVAALALPLLVAGVGVVGVFGWIGLPIHSVSLLVFPVLIGVGIDFGIRMASSYHAARAAGATAEAGARAAGEGTGPPLVVATLTTLVGMAVLLLAPNTLLQQLGLAIVVGLGLLLAVSLTVLPATLTWTATPRRRRTPVDRALAANARLWGRNRWLALGLAALLVAGSVATLPRLDSLVLGTPAGYFPPGDRQRSDFDRSNAGYFNDQSDLVTNVLVLEGNLTTPAAMSLLKDLESSLKSLDFVRKDSVVSIYFALNAWIQVRQGTAGAPAVIAQEQAQPGSTFPQDQAGIKALLDEMFRTPLANYASFFTVAPDYRIGTLLVEVRQPAGFAALKGVWDTLQSTIATVQGRHPDAGLRIHTYGATSIGYLFTAEEQPYLVTAALAGLAVTALQVLLYRRRARDAAIVTAATATAGLTWLGALALLRIPLSIGLLVPVVLLEAVGSTYALHLCYVLDAEGAQAWRTAGRAIYYSAITDVGAFAVFAAMRFGIVRQAALATVAALALALFATLLLVPALARRDQIPEATA